jgi:hypothetical protein
VILLDPIVEGVIASVNDLTAQDLANGTWVGIMPIGRHPLRCMTNHSDGLSEQALGHLQISLFAERRVNQVAITIKSPIQVAPFPFDAERGFIDMPGCSSLSPSPGAQVIRKQRSKARFPITHRFMRERKASFQKHLG